MGPKTPGIRTAPREPKAAWAPMVRRDARRLLPAPAWDPAAVPASSGPQLPTCAHCTLPSLASPALAQPQPAPHPLRPLCRLLSVPDSFDPLTLPPKPFRWLPMHPSQAPAAPSHTRKAPSSRQPQGHFPRLGALVSPQVSGWVSPHPRFTQGPAVVCTGGSSAHGQLHRPRRAPGATRSRPGPSSRTVSPRLPGCGLGRPRRTAPKWVQKRNPQSTRRGRPWQGEGTGSRAPPPAPLPVLDLPWQLAWPPWALG